jgi:hypothetical protein
MSDQSGYIAEQEQRRLQEHAQQLQGKQTLEVVELERQQVRLAPWQQWSVNILAVIGALTIIYLILSAIF